MVNILNPVKSKTVKPVKNYILTLIFEGSGRGYTYKHTAKCKKGDVVIVTGRDSIYSLAHVHDCHKADDTDDLSKLARVIEKTSLNMWS